MNDAHLEIVENPGMDQGFHNRIVAGNHETTWTTETFHREDSALHSLMALGRMFSPVGKATVNEHEMWVWLDDDELGAKLVVPIRRRETPEGRATGGPVEDDGRVPMVATDRGYKIPHLEIVETARRDTLLAAADDADRMARIGVTSQRDVSQEDLDWWHAEPQRSLLLELRDDYASSTELFAVAAWLRDLAGRQP